MPRNVLVTGGARGIGAGVVKCLAAEGYNVGFCGRGGAEKTESFLSALRAEYPGKFAYFQYDISSLEDHEKLLDAFEAEFGSLDVLVNNAGVAPEVRNDVLEMSAESFDRVMNINLRGPFFLT